MSSPINDPYYPIFYSGLFSVFPQTSEPLESRIYASLTRILFIQDGLALKKESNPEDYTSLENRLVDYLSQYGSHFSGKQRIHDIETQFYFINQYIDEMKGVFRNVDEVKVKTLKTAVLKAFIGKLPRQALHSIPDDGELSHLFDIAYSEKFPGNLPTAVNQ